MNGMVRTNAVQAAHLGLGALASALGRGEHYVSQLDQVEPAGQTTQTARRSSGRQAGDERGRTIGVSLSGRGGP